MPPVTGNDECSIDQRNEAYAGAVPHGISGFFTNFYSAATVLRVARQLQELDRTVALSPSSLDEFFSLLAKVEGELQAKSQKQPFVVVVEGLDGSGKSTLVETLATSLENAKACATPTASLKDVRPVFDKRGGPVARAFYMVTNFILQHEIRNNEKHSIFVVDRWFSSTCAYSIAWKNTTGGNESIDALPSRLFQWPHDLTPPQLMILLDLDDETRRQRVTDRAAAANFNPWDERLSNDALLGQRIMRAHERTIGPQSLVKIDASKSKEEVVRQALTIVQQHAERHFEPWSYFQQEPLPFFVWQASRLGFCTPFGSREKHAPWAFQLALNTTTSSDNTPCSPSLRTVGIHTTDSSGILFFTWGHPGGGQGGSNVLASMVCVLGEYPFEQQWRAEGILISSTLAECNLMGTLPPASLVAQISACARASADQVDTSISERPLLTDCCQKDARGLRQSPLPRSDQEMMISATRFVPLRMEVLMGGPSSPGGPRRFEWSRRRDSALLHNDGWEKAKSILPFSPPASFGSFPVMDKPLLPVTLAIMGSHCAGKKTIGEKVATIMGWQFHPELGDVLRDHDILVANGHVTGDGSGNSEASSDWDERIHKAECERDASNLTSRVVETWHVGNLAWELQRQPTKTSEDDTKRRLEKTRVSIQEELSNRRCVLFILLETSPETTLRRRHEDKDNALRLPLADEAAECRRLHQVLQQRGRELLGDINQNQELPVLVLNNDKDGEESMEEASRKIVSFIYANHWRRAAFLDKQVC